MPDYSLDYTPHYYIIYWKQSAHLQVVLPSPPIAGLPLEANPFSHLQNPSAGYQDLTRKTTTIFKYKTAFMETIQICMFTVLLSHVLQSLKLFYFSDSVVFTVCSSL